MKRPIMSSEAVSMLVAELTSPYRGPVLSLMYETRFDLNAIEYYWENPRTGTRSDKVTIGVNELSQSSNVQGLIASRAIATIGQVAIIEAVLKELDA